PWRRSPRTPGFRIRASSPITSSASSASRRGNSANARKNRLKDVSPAKKSQSIPPYHSLRTAWARSDGDGRPSGPALRGTVREASTVRKHHDEAGRGQALARSYDYVIIGAGSAGCVVARRLVDGTDATVLLLEAGGTGEGVASLSSPPQWGENLGSPYDWAYRYEPSPHVAGRSIPPPPGQVLGGAGRLHAPGWGPGAPGGRDGWAEAGNPLWDFISVLPLFKQSEDWEDGASEFRGAGGPIRVERARDLHPVAAAFIAAGRSCGMPYLDDLNVPEPEGVGPMNL